MCPDDGWQEFSNRPPGSLLALAGSIRTLTEQLLRVADLPQDVAAEARSLAGQADRLTGRLAPHARDDRMPRMGPEPTATRPYFVRGPIIGAHHPLQPLFEVEHLPGRSRGRVNFGVTYEGPPGCVHGGFVAFFFDEILGEHNVHARIPAMTGTLKVRYNAATPLFTDLDFLVHSRAHGPRKVLTHGTLAHGEVVFAEAEGLFIVPRSAQWNPEQLESDLGSNLESR